MTRTTRVLLTIAVITALIGLALILTPYSPAAQINLEILGGDLGFNFIDQPHLAPADITGGEQEATGTLGLLDIRDARGTGAGWRLFAEASDFIERGRDDHIIPAAGFLVNTEPTVFTVAGNTAPAGFTGPLNTPLKLAEAPAGNGMGRYQIQPAVTLNIPADVYAGEYDSTLTLTLVSGP